MKWYDILSTIIIFIVILQIIFYMESYSKMSECRDLHDKVYELYLKGSNETLKEYARGREVQCLKTYYTSSAYTLSIFKYEEYWDYGG